MNTVLKVSSKSKPSSLAGAISGEIKTSNQVEMHAVGAGAVNQAVKAIAVARGFLAPMDIDLIAIPSFAPLDIDGEERTMIKFILEKRKRGS